MKLTQLFTLKKYGQYEWFILDETSNTVCNHHFETIGQAKDWLAQNGYGYLIDCKIVS